ncbi:MAG: hypothetical protein KF704_02150 [Crocinitomicaceae bacterium]|nr:hypothetical protein [Crocinitomicaceae bacterium]
MYDLHLLGWKSFQDLCNSISREILGQTALTFLPSQDEGVDGSFSGKWCMQENLTLEGEFVIQCKFNAKQNQNFTFSSFSQELDKAKLLADRGECDIYILMTNAGVSKKTESKLRNAFHALGVKHFLVFGNDWICQVIRDNSKLRRLVPRVYGLGDLTQILDERVYAQGKALLDSMKDELAKVVLTKSYHKALKALEEHKFVLLTGEPSAGKSTIAALLAMGALDQWEALTMKLNKADQVVSHWNPKEPNQFFWIDDAFGPTQYETTLAYDWNRVMPEIVAMLGRGAKIVMTSREYIYKQAKKDLKSNAFPLLNESQVVIDVQDLTLDEKRQILYNHLKMGKQPKSFVTAIKPYLESIAAHDRFIPETARRISDPFFTKGLTLSDFWVSHFVESQESFLLDVIKNLDKNCQAALALIYMNNGALKAPLNLESAEINALDRMGSSQNGCADALDAMNGSLVRQLTEDDEMVWRYKHPTIGDAYSTYLSSSTELLEIYIQGSTLDKLMNGVTCGDVQLKGATIVPRNLFPLFLEKLTSYRKSSDHKSDFYATYYAKRNLMSFLATRCSVNFLKIYVDAVPVIYEDIVKVDLSTYTPKEISLAILMAQNGLLPEKYRKKTIQRISEFALTGENLDFLESEDVQSLFLDDELSLLKSQIAEQLLPDLSSMTERWKNSYRRDDAEYHMSSLKDNLRILEDAFPEVSELHKKIQKEIFSIDDWVEENQYIETVDTGDSSESSDDDSDVFGSGTKSIFDDVDI